MISKEEMMKRVRTTKWDIFPLDKKLPLATVYRIFLDEFNKHDDKSIFVRDRKYQRFMEGYFSLFVGISLRKRASKEHFIRFPKDAKNDVDFLSLRDDSGAKEEDWRLVCDVKEFTEYSGSFEQFVEMTVKPKIKAGAYHIIIGLHANVKGDDLEKLRKLSSKASTVWIVSSTSEDEQDYSSMLVTWLQGDEPIFQQIIDLRKELPLSEDPPIVYQDILREKLI